MEDAFCLDFSIDLDFFGEQRSIELRLGGAGVPVTEENRGEYVDLMVDYLLNK